MIHRSGKRSFIEIGHEKIFSTSTDLGQLQVKDNCLGLIFFNTWFTDFFSQNIKVRGGKKIKITKKIFFIQSETYLDPRKKKLQKLYDSTL